MTTKSRLLLLCFCLSLTGVTHAQVIGVPEGPLKISVPTNQPPTTASSMQILTEMLQQLPEGVPCNQDYNTFGVLATQQNVRAGNASGFYSDDTASKQQGQLIFLLGKTPVGTTASSNNQYPKVSYRIFVDNGQVCVGFDKGGRTLARNIQMLKLSSTTYAAFWYTPSGVVTLTFVKKRTTFIC